MISMLMVVLAGVFWFVMYRARGYPAFGGESILLIVVVGWVVYDWVRRRKGE